MASSRDTSNGPDWKDVTRALLDFQRSWEHPITIRLVPSGTFKFPKLTMQACAWSEDPESPAATCLAYASVSMPGNGAGDLCAALLLLGYELDKDVYRREMGISEPLA